MLIAVEEQVHIQQPSVVKSKNATTKGAKLPEGPHLRRFSLDEFQQLVKLGFFDEDERIELLDGLVVEMGPINPRHAVCVDKLGGLINHLLYQKAWIRVQAPITLEGSASQPQPDLTVALLQPEAYEERHVNAQEVLLLIEVADSSLQGDQIDKLNLYAAAGISEYWIVNLVDNQVEVYQEPYLSIAGEGTYKIKRTYSRDQVIAPQAFPDCEIALNDILPRGS